MRMRIQIGFLCFGLVALSICGCGGSAPTTVAVAENKPEYALGELLDKPRSELAELATELQSRVTMQRRAVQEGRLHLGFLPNLPMPLIIPVWTEAAYSDKRGISLPPYVQGDGPDRELALHLASFGDHEGATILADPKDAATQKTIADNAYERNYPAEWIRLAALLLYDAELRMAQGDKHGARDLLAYHWQIKEILGPKATKGWLGQALLPVGRSAFEQAVPAWQKSKVVDLAKEGKALLEDTHDWRTELKFGFDAPFATIDRTFTKDNTSRAALATDPRRAFDIMSLPLPVAGVGAVVAFFDENEKMDQLLVLYKPGVSEGYKDAQHLLRMFHDRGLESRLNEDSPGVPSKLYLIGKVRCEAAVMPRNTTVSAFITFRKTDAKNAPYQLERTFGAATLDRSFEQNRLRLVPQQRKNQVSTRQPGTLALIANPLPALALNQLGIEHAPGQELTGGLEFGFTAIESKPAPFQAVMMPLWSHYGFAPFRGVIDEVGGHFSFVWQDDRTRDELIVPFETSQPIRLKVSDKVDTSAVAKRTDDTRNRDMAERLSRIAAGKPIQQIPRKLDQFYLGETREELLSHLPTGQAALKRDIPDGLMVTFPIENSPNATHVLRQAFIRFDGQGRAAEIRVRYDDGPTRGKSSWAGEILNELRKHCGASETIPCPWTAVWNDLPSQKPAPTSFAWSDDISRLRYYRDAGGVEEILVNCPADQPGGVALPPLEVLPRGSDKCQLGMTREQINEIWKDQKPVAASDGALVLRPSAATGMDVLLVYFDKDQVVRILGRHKQPAGKVTAALSEAVRAAWSKGMRTQGWPRRQDSAPGNLLQGLAWHDDATRVRVFWLEPDDGPARVFTEWKALATP